jgi:(p)ppGpp synthase/HD superfamily hydrolase
VFQLYLENGAFAILEPDEFKRIYDYVEKNYSRISIDNLIVKLKKLLTTAGIKYKSIS